MQRNRHYIYISTDCSCKWVHSQPAYKHAYQNGDYARMLWYVFLHYETSCGGTESPGDLGLGAFTAPFASTYFSGFADRRWAFHFILSAGLALSNLAVLLWVFRFRRQEGSFIYSFPYKRRSWLNLQMYSSTLVKSI